ENRPAEGAGYCLWGCWLKVETRGVSGPAATRRNGVGNTGLRPGVARVSVLNCHCAHARALCAVNPGHGGVVESRALPNRPFHGRARRLVGNVKALSKDGQLRQSLQALSGQTICRTIVQFTAVRSVDALSGRTRDENKTGNGNARQSR